MAENALNQTVLEAVTQTNNLVSSIDTITAQGAGKAYQGVAHSVALAVQDGTDYLRNVATIATSGIGVATAKLIETKDPQYGEIIETLQKAVQTAAGITKDVGMNSGSVLGNFPNGKGS